MLHYAAPTPNQMAYLAKLMTTTSEYDFDRFMATCPSRKEMSDKIDEVKRLEQKRRAAVLPEPGYYLTDDEVYVVVKGRITSDKLYAKRLVIPGRASSSGGSYVPRQGSKPRARWFYVRGKIFELDASKRLHPEDAARLGHQHGYCVVCGMQLMDPKSVTHGIGPTCRRRLQRAMMER